jgi:hypothetical protein
MDRSTAESLLSLAEQAAPRIKGVEAKATLSELEERSTELLEAIEWFVDQQRTDDALRLANALYGFWITKQRFDEGRRGSRRPWHLRTESTRSAAPPT